MIRNNVYALVAHAILVGLLWFISLNGRVSHGSAESLLVISVCLYFVIAWSTFRSQKTFLADLVSVVSVALLGCIVTIIIYQRWSHLPGVYPPMFLNFYDLVAWYWMKPMYVDPIQSRMAILVAWTIIPTMSMWFGLLMKRRTRKV